MHIYILTLFPEIFPGPLASSIIGRAIEKELVTLSVINIRDFTTDKHKTCDDTPYGGGPGMVMKAEPICKALESISLTKEQQKNTSIIVTSAKGKTFTQTKARDYSKKKNLIIICGHYEGIDQRVIDLFGAEEISIGEYVLTGGEIPAMVIADVVSRLLPNVLGKEASLDEESHTIAGQLEYPHYTKPQDFRGLQVPDVLLSGNHAEIAKWRKRESVGKSS
jgi:tRNA (guanine37-N1)-methyltransferase